MKHKILGRTSIEVSELCYGTLILGPLQANISPAEGSKAVRRALELGVNFIDTAKTYITHEHVRLGIEGFRDTVIATKSPAKNAKEMREDVEHSLRELGRDTIDIFHLHFVRNADDMRTREDALGVLEKCRNTGMIRAIGLSAHGIQGTKCALDYNEIDVVFPLLNSKGLGIMDGTVKEMIDVIQALHNDNRGLYAMKPLGGGHLIDDIPAAIEYLRGLNLFASISAGLRTPEEAEVMAGVFKRDSAAIERALEMGKDRTKRKKLIIYDFLCELCGSCVEACGQNALSLGEKKPEVDPERCILCGYCAADCPKFAIRVI